MSLRNWCFTLNNPGNGPLTKEDFPDGLRYCSYQRESGEKGTEHYQGYCEFTKPVRLAAFKKSKVLGRAHLEPRRGTRDQAREYTRKAESRIAGPWEIGSWLPTGKGGTAQGKRTDWDDLKEDLKTGMNMMDLTETHFSKVVMYSTGISKARSYLQEPRKERTKVFIIYGPPGTGKTTFALETYPGAYWKPPRTKWFDGYGGEDVIVMDEFSGGWFEFDLWKRLGDGSPLQVEFKGGYAQMAPAAVVYISNFHPSLWYSKLFLKYPDQLQALSRRVDGVTVFTALGEHYEHALPKEFVELEGPDLNHYQEV